LKKSEKINYIIALPITLGNEIDLFFNLIGNVIEFEKNLKKTITLLLF